MIQAIKVGESQIKMRGISLQELKSCPKFILSASHWIPVHKVEECGANEKKQEVRVEAQVEIKKPVKRQQSKMYQDIEKTCVQCSSPFTWTAGEQRFMNRLHEEGKIQSVSEPKRCPDCRAKKKERFDKPQVHLP